MLTAKGERSRTAISASAGLASEGSGRLWLLPAALFLVGFVGYALPAVGWFTAVPGDIGDARFNSVILEHVYRWLTGREASLWSPPFFYPFERVLAFSDNHFGTVAFYVPLRILGLERETAFIGWFLIGIVLNFLAAYAASRTMGLSAVGASFAAFVFAFSLPVLQHEIHAQLNYRFGVPLAFAAFWRLLEHREISRIVPVVAWTVLQFFASIYIGLFLVYLLGATAAAWLFLGRRRGATEAWASGLRARSRARNLGSGTAVTLLAGALAWLLLRYYRAMLEYDLSYPREMISAFLPPLDWYFIPGSLLFFGFATGTLLLVGSWASARGADDAHRAGRVVLLALVLLFVGTVRIGEASLYMALVSIPGIGAVRAVMRIVVVMALPVGLLVGIGAERIAALAWERRPQFRALAVGFAVAALAAETALHHPRNVPVREWRDRAAVVAELLPEDLPADAILWFHGWEVDPHYPRALDAMFVAQDLGIPTLNGYSGHVPPGYVFPGPCHAPETRMRGYVEFRGLSEEDLEALMERVVQVPLDVCADEP